MLKDTFLKYFYLFTFPFIAIVVYAQKDSSYIQGVNNDDISPVDIGYVIISQNKHIIKKSNRDSVIVNHLLQDSFYKDDDNGERGSYRNANFIIKYDFDLMGDTLYLPENSILHFCGGSIKNGVLVGFNSQIRADRKTIFKQISILGSWKTPVVYAEWFENIRNAIREPFKMLSADLQNTLIIEKGIWETEMDIDEKYAITIPSNTEVILNGTIRNYTNLPGGFSIFKISDSKNVRVFGSGEIIGNRDDRAVAKRGSQTGHSITIGSSTNVSIEGITLSYSRGDGILIGDMEDFNMPENVIVRNVRILHSRRQGVSICAGHNIIIENLYINDVSGAPQGPCAGIDIENYDEGGVIGNIIIRNVMVCNVSKGLAIYNDSDVTTYDKDLSFSGRSDLSRIHITNYIAKDCIMGLRIGYLTESILIENSHFEASDVAISLFSDYDQNHDYTHQCCHQIRNCRFFAKTAGLKASVDIRTKNIFFENCAFEVSSPFTVHESANSTSFRNCSFNSTSQIRLFDKSILSDCDIHSSLLTMSKGAKAFNCKINSVVTLVGDNILQNCDLLCQGMHKYLLVVKGKGYIIKENRFNYYDDEFDIGKDTNILNIVHFDEIDGVFEDNVIGLKNCKVALGFSSELINSPFGKNKFIESVPYVFKDRDGISRTLKLKNGIPFPESLQQQLSPAN